MKLLTMIFSLSIVGCISLFASVQVPSPSDSNLVGCGGGVTMADLAGEYYLRRSDGSLADTLSSGEEGVAKAEIKLEENGEFTLEWEAENTLSLVITGTGRFREIGLYLTALEFEGVDKSDGKEYGGTIEDLFLSTVRSWSMAGFCQYLGDSRFPVRFYWDGQLADRVFFERK